MSLLLKSLKKTSRQHQIQQAGRTVLIWLWVFGLSSLAFSGFTGYAYWAQDAGLGTFENETITPIIGIFGSFASAFSFFFALVIYLQGVGQSAATEMVLQQTQAAVATIADRLARKPIIGMEAILLELESFLERAKGKPRLFILTPMAAIGEIHALRYGEKHPLSQRIRRIQALLLERAQDVNAFYLATLTTRALRRTFIPTVWQASLLNLPSDPAKEALIAKHKACLEAITQTCSGKQRIEPHLKSLEKLPFQLFILEKDAETQDYESIVLYLGNYNFEAFEYARADHIEADEQLSFTFLSIFEALTELDTHPDYETEATSGGES